MSFNMLFVFMAGAVIAMPIAHALLMGAMAAAATSAAGRACGEEGIGRFAMIGLDAATAGRPAGAAVVTGAVAGRAGPPSGFLKRENIYSPR